MIHILITLLVTAVGFFIVSKLPTGVEIDSFGKAIVSAIVFGILNAFIHPILDILAFPINFLTFGLISGLFNLIFNAIIFGLAAALVKGFRLRWSILSAFLGAFVLAVFNSIVHHLFPFTA